MLFKYTFNNQTFSAHGSLALIFFGGWGMLLFCFFKYGNISFKFFILQYADVQYCLLTTFYFQILHTTKC